MRTTKKTLLATAPLACLLLAGTAHADPAGSDSWYVGGSGDLTWMRHSDTGGGGNLDLGYQFKGFRAEAEAGYHGAPGNSGYSNTHYYDYMGNLLYDFTSLSGSYGGWHVAPYIGAGIGDGQVHSGGESNNSFAYQGLAGLTFVPSDSSPVDWSLGYRYFATDDSNPHAHSLELGARYHF